MGTTGLNPVRPSQGEAMPDPLTFKSELERDLRDGGATEDEATMARSGTSSHLARDWRDAEIELRSAEVAALRRELELLRLEQERATAREAELRKEAADGATKLAQLEAAMSRLQVQYVEACSARDRLQAELARQIDEFSQSLSWRITAPLRAASTYARRLRSPR